MDLRHEHPIAFVLLGFEDMGPIISDLDCRPGRMLFHIDENFKNVISKSLHGQNYKQVRASGARCIVLHRQGFEITHEKRATLTEILGSYTDEEVPSEDLTYAIIRHENSILHDVVSNFMRSVADSNLALASLRMEHERLQGAFIQLESAFANRAASPAAFQNAPLEDWFWPSKTEGTTLRQLLPIVGATLSVLTLTFKPSNDIGQGAIRVRLVSNETGEDLAVWIAHYADIHDGAHEFVCRRVLPSDVGRVRIELEWHTIAGTPPAVRLADSGGWRAGQCRVGLSLLRGRMLALRLMAGPSATSAIRSPYVEWAKSNNLTIIGLDLTPTVLSKIRALTRADDFLPVEAKADPLHIQIHPPREGATVALAEACLPSGTHEVTAYVTLEAKGSRDVEFAMGIIETSEKSESALEASALALIDDLKWTRVAQGRSAIIAASLALPSKRVAHLVLATRMAVPGNNDFGWARWSSIKAKVAAFRELPSIRSVP